MNIFCLGTAAELIKTYPVLVRLKEAGASYLVFSTGQCPQTFKKQYIEFDLPSEKYRELNPGRTKDISNKRETLFWLLSTLVRAAFMPCQRKSTWIVQGDTLSTAVGAFIARAKGAKLYHIEAGMRTGNWTSPFPEEICRRFVTALTHVHFCSDEKAMSNLAGKKNLIYTHGNTQFCAITAALQRKESSQELKHYAVANLHRFENINSNWQILIDVVKSAAKNNKLYFVLHKHVENKITPQLREQLEALGCVFLPRQGFIAFTQLLQGARFFLTDGGGNQNDSLVLGLPTLIIRTKVETDIGLWPHGPCVLAKMDSFIMDDFLKDPEKYRKSKYTPIAFPSAIIAKELLTH